MLITNEYFAGNVKSIAFQNEYGNFTVGVMDLGEFEFGTNTIERMTVISGKLTVQLPGNENWQDFLTGETFTVPAQQKFRIKVQEQTAYLCRYE
ncbi:MAG TPA: pyrimidine/purine nucleoside phosphorylase [Candidatus Cloacimonas sp.]|nr:pyrimidine/purine nucleoside phosphorylase [Candidatus Cloacimonas sp.]